MGWNEEANNVKEQELPKEEIQFTTLSEAKEKRGLKIGIYGDYATGKTHFGLTAPEPIYILDTELGASPLADKFKGKDIRILDVAEKDGSKSYQKIVDAVEYISKQEKVGTVILDSISDLWEFSQEYGKVNIFKIKPEQRLAQQWDWGVLNKLYMNVLMKLIKLDCNLIVTSREAEIYAGAGQPTNQVKAKWQKTTGFWVDLVLHNTKKFDKLGKTNFNTHIEKCRQSGELMGKSFVSLDFKKLEEELNKVEIK